MLHLIMKLPPWWPLSAPPLSIHTKVLYNLWVPYVHHMACGWERCLSRYSTCKYVQLISSCQRLIYIILSVYYGLQFYVTQGISLQDLSPYKYNYAWLKLSYTNAFTNLTFIHPTVIINNERGRLSITTKNVYTHNLVTTCFHLNRPSSCNTEYQKYTERLMQI